MQASFRLLLKIRYLLEAGLIGLFLIQALRYLIGALYARISSASVFPVVNPDLVDPTLPGLIAPNVISSEIILLVYMIALPILALLFGRFRAILVLAAVGVAVGRALMNVSVSITLPASAAITIGCALLYLAVIIRWRARTLPYFFVYGFAADQVLRAFGNTLDPSTQLGYVQPQLFLSGLLIGLALINFFRQDADERAETRHLLTFWSGLGLGALLFLEIALLALPNAVAGRANTDYTRFVPLLLIATLLPIVPQIREWAKVFIGIFDASLRGWAWMLLVALLVVIGTRFGGTIAGVALVIAQFCVSMMWWWLARPQTEKERSFSGLWVTLSALVFAVLIVFDLFTYEYAYVREFTARLAFLNDIIPPLIRGFRGLGLGVILLSVFIAALPMLQGQRRIPWKGSTILQSVLGILLITLISGGAAYAARPIVVTPVREVETLNIATYNIHAGYNEFFHYDLEAIAQTIAASTANVILLQEVEIGRSTSFGVDQALWLARRLGMDTRFYATNEGLQGLAVLSRVPIIFDDGTLLTSTGQQTGLQRVQIQPDDQEITLYNTWLGVLVEGVGDRTISDQEQDQRRQLDQIFGIMNFHNPNFRLRRVVLGGTFHNVPDSELIQQVRSIGFTTAFDDPAFSAPTFQVTFWQTSIGRRARLDYLWVLGMSNLRAGVVDTHASDHRLAVVELGIRR